jgi:hypothetical protein
MRKRPGWISPIHIVLQTSPRELLCWCFGYRLSEADGFKDLGRMGVYDG